MGATRAQLLGALVLLALANATIAQAWATAMAQGWLAAALNGFGYSWALWLASALAVRLALRAGPAPASPADLAVALAALAMLALPASHGLSAVAATLVAAWFSLRPGATPALRAAALVLLAIAIDLVWVGAAMLMFGGQVEAFDAHLAGALSGAAVDGNQMRFLHGGGGFYVAMGCTAVENVAMGLLLWFAIVRSARPALRTGDLKTAAGVALSVAALNTGRLVLMARDAQSFHLAHGTLGSAIFSVLVTATGLAWALWDVRKQLFDPVLDSDAGAGGLDRRRQAGASPAADVRPAAD